MNANDAVEVVASAVGAAGGAYVAARTMGVQRLVALLTRAVRVGVHAELEPVTERVDVLEADMRQVRTRLDLPRQTPADGN